jgi:antitoxin FitA
MGKHVQIRNLDDKLRRKLKVRAAKTGTTISDDVKTLLERDLSKPTMTELGERLRRLPPVHFDPSLEELVREDRDSR